MADFNLDKFKPTKKIVADESKAPWKAKPRSELTKQELAAWDRETEVDFQRAQAEYKKAHQSEQFIRCPMEFIHEAAHATKGDWTALMLALLIYRRCCLCKSLTVKLPGRELADLGITRRKKNEALLRLQVAGLIRLQPNGKGRSVEITLLWSR